MTKANAMLRIGACVLGMALLTSAMPPPSDAQTEGMKRRADRRGDRNDARGTRQSGRETGRAAKHECIAGDDSRAECRQQKRGIKQDARQKAREQKWGD